MDLRTTGAEIFEIEFLPFRPYDSLNESIFSILWPGIIEFHKYFKKLLRDQL